MSIPKPLIKYLDQSKIKYEVVEHKTVYTARDKAQTLRINPKMVVKTLVIKADNNYALVSIPAGKNLDKPKFKKTWNAWLKKQGKKTIKKIDFAKEAWMKKNILGEVGATPPFGASQNLPEFIDGSLLREKNLFVNAGDYTATIKLSAANFKKANKDLIIGNFSIKS